MIGDRIRTGWAFLVCISWLVTGCVEESTKSTGPVDTSLSASSEAEPGSTVPAASTEGEVPAKTPLATEAVESRPDKPEFESSLLKIAEDYEAFTLVDSHLHWANTLCAPSGSPETKLRESSNPDPSTHGKKLYAIFARRMFEVHRTSSGVVMRPFYVSLGKPNPIGQAVVKEAWVPQETSEGDEQWVRKRAVDRMRKDVVPEKRNQLPLLPARDLQGKFYYPKEKATLFIMYKLSPETPETDEGWVYGIVTGDGRAVIDAGRITSCMNCHREAPYDRLFGPPVPKD